MTWKYGVRGILVWQSNYWTSPCAFPKEPQNPWEDPMGYVSGYDNPPGYIGYWGNGDGRFIYPANRDVRNDRRPYIEGPMNSIRWEMLREGIEDYEMFVLLRDLVARARRARLAEGEVRAAEALLEIPESIIRDRTHFTKDPRDLDRHREKVAEAIEGLAKRITAKGQSLPGRGADPDGPGGPSTASASPPSRGARGPMPSPPRGEEDPDRGYSRGSRTARFGSTGPRGPGDRAVRRRPPPSAES